MGRDRRAGKPTPELEPSAPAAPERERGAVAGLVLWPGAGAGRDHGALVAIDHALCGTPIAVERVDFPYRLAGRRAPDRPPVLVGAVVDASQRLAGELGCAPECIAMGGRSMGGRICSMAVAEGLAAAALVLVSYPLHPPGKPDRLRVGHFPSITVPCLFVSGTRDAFATPDELQGSTGAISGPVTHAWVEGGDHALRGKDQPVAEIVRDWLTDL